jgi:hypothetical protein
MREAGTGLLRGKGKCAGNSRGISEIRADLVFRCAEDQCSQKPNEIRGLHTELVFREAPGKLVEWRGHAQRFRSLRLRRALVNPPRNAIAGIPIAPVRLGPLTARRLTFRIPAGSLTGAHSRVRPEPPATDCARSLPGLGHRDDSSSSSRPQQPANGRSDQDAWVISGEQRWVTSRERRRPTGCVLNVRACLNCSQSAVTVAIADSRPATDDANADFVFVQAG